MSNTLILQEELFNSLLAEANHPFSGWDFSHITMTGRMVDAPLTWSYASIVLNHLKSAQSLLDMDTGGGEYLSSLQPLPSHTCATEGYAPNVSVARKRLEPLGVQVYEAIGKSELPFAANQFDLVINRHGAYIAKEVWRILKPGGLFITQQVDCSNFTELNALLNAPPSAFQYLNWRLESAIQEVQPADWHVIAQKEEQPITRFFDIGAIIYYLKAISWQVPDFTVEKYFDKLVEIHNKIQRDGYIDIHYHRFLIVARKL